MSAYCRLHDIALTPGAITVRGCCDPAKQARGQCKHLDEINWATVTAWEIRSGCPVGTVKAISRQYGVYLWHGYLVELDEADGEIAGVFLDGATVWLGEATKIGLAKLVGKA